MHREHRSILPAIVSSRSMHRGLEHRRIPSVLDLMDGSRATPAPSIARCLAASSSSSRFFCSAFSASVSPIPFIIASATFLSLAVSAFVFFSVSGDGAVYAPSLTLNVRVNASKDSHPLEAPLASNLGEYRASSLNLRLPSRHDAVRASYASTSPSHNATTSTVPSSVPASANRGDGACIAVTGEPTSIRACALPLASQRIIFRSAPPETILALSPGTFATHPTSPAWYPFHGAYASPTFHAMTAPPEVPTQSNSPSKVKHRGSPSPAVTSLTPTTAPPSPVLTSRSAASTPRSPCGSSSSVNAWTHAVTDSTLAVKRSGVPFATPSTEYAACSLPDSRFHTTSVRFVGEYAVSKFASVASDRRVTGCESTRSG